MRGMRIASGILAAGLVATAATASVAAVASQQPSGTPASQHPSETVSSLWKRPLPNVKGKTFTSEIVYFPPNARASPPFCAVAGSWRISSWGARIWSF